MQRKADATLARKGELEPFQAIFGDKPRIRLVEAALRLRRRAFTRGEWAAEANLTRASTHRSMGYLEALGIVQRKTGGRTPQYIVNTAHPLVGELARAYQAFNLAIKGVDVAKIRAGARASSLAPCVRVSLSGTGKATVAVDKVSSGPVVRVSVDPHGIFTEAR